MRVGAILFLAFLSILVILDAAMIFSLVCPGKVVQSLVYGQLMAVNPFSSLCAAALIYFALLLFFRKKHGGRA